jgi:hypothetical protein
MRRLQPVLQTICLATTIALGLAHPAAAAKPVIRDVNFRGLQIGGTTTIVVDGTNLLPDPKLISTLPITKQTLRPKSNANRLEIDVTVNAQAIPGFYNIWIANRNGVSQRVVVAVDHLPQALFTPELKTLPVVLHGKLTGSTRLRTSFTGKKGQQLVFEIEAQRLGSKIRPVLHLYNSNQRQLTWAMPSRSLHGDSRIQTTLPADGKYTLELHDLQYAAPAPNYFRLKIGNWKYTDLVFPPAVQQGKATSLELIGNSLKNNRVSLTATGLLPNVPAPWLNQKIASGMQPKITVSSYPEVTEVASGKLLQKLPAIPCGISGRLSQPGEQDLYELNVKTGDRLRFEVFADRIGSPVDTILELQNSKGGRLALNDDTTNTTDSRIDYTVPAKIQQIRLVIKDANDRSGQRCIYRVAVTKLNAAAANDFQLTLQKSQLSIPGKGRLVLKVTANRQGYKGPITLAIPNLAKGIQLSGNTIPAGENATLLTLSGNSTALTSTVTIVRGTTVGLNPAVSRVAIDSTHPSATLQPWLGSEVAIGTSSPSTIGFGIDWNKLPGNTQLVLGGRLNLPVKSQRPGSFDGPVRLTLLTNQIPPIVRNRPDPARTIRRESRAVVEIPIDKKTQAANNAKVAAEKALAVAKTAEKAAKTDPARKQAAVKVKAAEAKLAVAEKNALTASAAAKNEVEFKVLIPATLPAGGYQLTLQAELLSRDKRTVLATSVIPVRRFKVVSPFTVVPIGSSPIEATREPKKVTTAILAGKIDRRAGFKGDVTVSVAGLPRGIVVPKAVLKVGKNNYRLEVKFPTNSKLGEVKGLTVFATGRFDPKSPVVRNTSQPLAIKLVVAKLVRAKKPK